MKRIYEVQYEEKWTGCGEWVCDSINVLGNGDALNVVKKAKQYAVGRTFKDDETGKINRCTGFRFVGVKVIASADI